MPDDDSALLLTGTICFTATSPGLETITDAYQVSISVPPAFPRETPRVKEQGYRIDRAYHRLSDGSFCLGSPARLRLALATKPTLLGFINSCVIPYLYGYSFFERHGRPPFGELAHGDRGLIEDFMRIFGAASASACAGMLALTGMKKRVANKHRCPCGSGERLGRCHHLIVNRLRPQLGRGWCRAQAAWLIDEYVDTLEASEPAARLQLATLRPGRNRKEVQLVPTSVDRSTSDASESSQAGGGRETVPGKPDEDIPKSYSLRPLTSTEQASNCARGGKSFFEAFAHQFVT